MIHITVKSRIEFASYFKFIFRENFFKPLPLVVIFFTLINLFLLLNYYMHWFYFNLTFPWFQMILVPLVFIVIPLYFYIDNRINYKYSEALKELKIFEFTENDVRISTPSSTLLIEWRNLYKVTESRDFLILFYDHATAYFVMKKDFKIPEDLQIVYDIIKSKEGLVQALLK